VKAGTRACLCLVTDRRRLCASLLHPLSDWRDVLLEQIRGAVTGGIDLVQIREPDLTAADLAELVRSAVALADGSAARVVVNDRVDVALVSGAGGVHLREDSISADQARRVGPGRWMIGRSIHGPEGVLEAGRVDYLIAGTIFPTASKPSGQALLGIDGLAAVVARAATTPVFAIGGVSAGALPALVRAGASGVAGIGVFIPATAVRPLAWSVQQLVENLRLGFDTASTVS
jgi:thiamine-phosphate diphosphorylase